MADYQFLPYEFDEKTSTFKWKVKCDRVQHPLEKICTEILEEKEGEKKTKDRPEGTKGKQEDSVHKDRTGECREEIKSKFPNENTTPVITEIMTKLKLYEPEVECTVMDEFKEAEDLSTDYLFGPRLPDLGKLVKLSRKPEEELRAVAKLSKAEWQELMNGKNRDLNLWGPVFAQIAVLTKRPLVRLLSKEDPGERLGWGTQQEDGTWTITHLPTVGATCMTALNQVGAMATLHRLATRGWLQWKGQRLTTPELEVFFKGECRTAELAAGILVKLASSASSKLVFAMFM